VSTHTSPVRLYRFYNWQVSKHGEPFSLCDECLKKQPVPPNFYLEKMADNSASPCADNSNLNPREAEDD
jgi:hypothetical protein